DEPVRPGSDGNLLEADVVQVRKRRPESVRATVRIAVEAWRRALDRLERSRKRSERPFVRRQLDHPFEPELPLHLLDRLAGLIGHQVAERWAEEAGGDVGQALSSGRCHTPNLLGRVAALAKAQPTSSPRRAYRGAARG